ncbi:uncharacterized protein Smp_201360 [Schistosoma mansoni]|uniref:uncharacterized protein n=1 Tax=Schistosoma mansoni TaxID=6183 RepID=UPI00022DC8AE|nr:uncharacterized protein Smp_201360 [Schistosoma mansoni]|eukprot:XP_018649591.1 uncharacterized protein Smp_201360 [Schistosoma mansoni]
MIHAFLLIYIYVHFNPVNCTALPCLLFALHYATPYCRRLLIHSALQHYSYMLA